MVQRLIWSNKETRVLEKTMTHCDQKLVQYVSEIQFSEMSPLEYKCDFPLALASVGAYECVLTSITNTKIPQITLFLIESKSLSYRK